MPNIDNKCVIKIIELSKAVNTTSGAHCSEYRRSKYFHLLGYFFLHYISILNSGEMIIQ